MPKTIISDRDAKFTSNFWKGLFAGFGTQLAFNTAYHSQTDGQTKRVNRVLEEMLRMYAMHRPNKWEDHLPLVEFSYNNGYVPISGKITYPWWSFLIIMVTSQ
jgi:hypothetical protein